MDALSSVAVVGQLLGQAINIWQEIDQVRQTIKAAPKVLEDLKVQSTNLQNTLRDIEDSKQLHTQSIHTQIAYIYSISLELQQILKRLTVLNRQGILRQSLHVLSYRARDESKLNDVLSRIEAAKNELSLRMSLVHIEKTGRLSEGLGNIETNTHRNETDYSPMITVDRNHTDGTAGQTCAVAGLENCKIPFNASITDNSALDKSRQTNLILCGAGSMALLQAVLLEA